MVNEYTTYDNTGFICPFHLFLLIKHSGSRFLFSSPETIWCLIHTSLSIYERPGNITVTQYKRLEFQYKMAAFIMWNHFFCSQKTKKQTNKQAKKKTKNLPNLCTWPDGIELLNVGPLKQDLGSFIASYSIFIEMDIELAHHISTYNWINKMLLTENLKKRRIRKRWRDHFFSCDDCKQIFLGNVKKKMLDQQCLHRSLLPHGWKYSININEIFTVIDWKRLHACPWLALDKVIDRLLLY